MDFEHIVIHKDMEWHSAFPEIIRLQNGEMVCVFRQAPVRPGTGVHGEQGASVTHFHQDANSRSVMVRSLDDGLTWDPSTRVIVSESDGTQDHNLAMVSQVSSGELIANNLRLFAYLDDAGKAKLAGKRRDHAGPASQAVRQHGLRQPLHDAVERQRPHLERAGAIRDSDDGVLDPHRPDGRRRASGRHVAAALPRARARRRSFRRLLRRRRKDWRCIRPGIRRPLVRPGQDVGQPVGGDARPERSGQLPRAAPAEAVERQVADRHEDGRGRRPLLPGLLGRRRLDVGGAVAHADRRRAEPPAGAGERPHPLHIRLPAAALRNQGMLLVRRRRHLGRGQRGGDSGTTGCTSTWATPRRSSCSTAAYFRCTTSTARTESDT